MIADVAVVGAGPAGLAAATRAAESGASVVVLDESPAMGGQIWRHRQEMRAGLPRDGQQWMSRFERSGARLVSGASVAAVRAKGPGGHLHLMTERANAAEQVIAGKLILATGARERFIPFPGWTLPGVIGVGGAQALLKSGVSFTGKRVVIAGSGPLLLPVAAALSASGARVVLVAEQAPARAVANFALDLFRRPGTLMQAARYRVSFRGAPYRLGTWVSAARGGATVTEVDVTNGRTTTTIACDVLCAAQGLIPNTELAALTGCEVTAEGTVVVSAAQETSVPGVYAAGENTGIGGADLAIVEGEIAGLNAVGRHAESLALEGRRARLRDMAIRMERAFALRSELRSLCRPDTIICRCEDVASAAIDPAWSMRQAKLYARAGMGPCQGRVCGAALEFIHGWRSDTVRVPSQPVLLSTLVTSRVHDRDIDPSRS